MTTDQKIINHKLGLLKLTQTLGSVSHRRPWPCRRRTAGPRVRECSFGSWPWLGVMAISFRASTAPAHLSYRIPGLNERTQQRLDRRHHSRFRCRPARKTAAWDGLRAI